MKRKFKSTLAIVLSVAVMFTFIPLMGGTAMAASKLKAPTVKVSKTTDESVTLSWGKVKGAKSYLVYQKVGNSFEKIAKTTAKTNTVTDLKKNSTYKFKVAAAAKKNGSSVGSKSKAVIAKTGKSVDFEAKMIADAEKVYAKSAAGLDTAEDIAENLAFNEEYWDSNEGFRNAGSDAEHKAAKYLENEWKNIGLTDVQIDEVSLDKWQFNDANLTVEWEKDGVAQDPIKLGFDKDESKSIVSYAASGTKQAEEAGTVEKGTYAKGVEIVYCGTGSLDDLWTYATNQDGSAIDVKGKIALVGIDQWNDVWITQSYNELYTQGAIGVIAYNTGGYAQYSEDANHVQDICSDDLGIPCTDISKKNGEAIKNAIEASKGKAIAKLYVDNELKTNQGTGYNVVGTLEGTGNTGQQLIYAGHYDKYFYGYEDDCLAVGLTGGIAKAMVDANYKPVNDIIFVAHCAEEWGYSGTEYDWAIGSYREITEAHPEWQGTTLALYNFELPGIATGGMQYVPASQETVSLVNDAIGSDSELVKNAYKKSEKEAAYKGYESTIGLSYADTIGYEQCGVPVYMNYTQYEKYNPDYDHPNTWSYNRYHTQYDNKNPESSRKHSSGWEYEDGYYSSDLMQQHICYWSALGIHQDQTPALVLDFENRYDQMYEAMFDEHGNKVTEAATDAQAKSYKKALDAFKKAITANKKEGTEINADYVTALKAGDTVGAKKAKEAAIAYNEKSLDAFRAIQDKLISVDIGSYESDISHTLLEANYEIYAQAADAESLGLALKSAVEGDYWLDYSYGCACSDETLDRLLKVFTNDERTWGKSIQKKNGLEDVWKTTRDLYQDYYWYDQAGYPTQHDLAYYQKAYAGYAKIAKAQTQKYVKAETKSINSIADMF